MKDKKWANIIQCFAEIKSCSIWYFNLLWLPRQNICNSCGSQHVKERKKRKTKRRNLYTVSSESYGDVFKLFATQGVPLEGNNTSVYWREDPAS